MHESTQSFIDAAAEGHTWERRSPIPEDEQVLGHTWNWLGALPTGVRPDRLPADFPRIANDLSRLWPETAALDLYFGALEFSTRANRKGFSPFIREELLALHAHSLRNRPVPYGERAPQQMSLLG
jgi:hypothetical protein